MAYTYPVPRWEFLLGAAARDIRFEEVGGVGVSVQTLPNVTYVNSGDGSAAPKDLCAALETAIEAAYNAIFGAGADYTVSLDADGRCTIVNNSAEAVDIAWAHVATTFLEAQLGFADATLSIAAGGGTATSPDLAHYQWHAGIWPLWSGMDLARVVRACVETLDGVPHEVIVGGSTWYERRIPWVGIPAARMLDEAAADAAYAAFAGFTTGESQTLQRLWDFLDITTAPTLYPTPREVWLYSTNDPATASRSSSRYKVLREGDWLQGVPFAALSQEYAAASFNFDLVLRR